MRGWFCVHASCSTQHSAHFCAFPITTFIVYSQCALFITTAATCDTSSIFPFLNCRFPRALQENTAQRVLISSTSSTCGTFLKTYPHKFCHSPCALRVRSALCVRFLPVSLCTLYFGLQSTGIPAIWSTILWPSKFHQPKNIYHETHDQDMHRCHRIYGHPTFWIFMRMED